MSNLRSTLRVQILAAAILAATAIAVRAGESLQSIAREVRPKVVKIYGAGGLRGLEAYQSGMIVSAEGHVLTAWSYVLDSDDVAVVLDDGRRYKAEYLGSDPLTEVAVLKIDAGKDKLAHFTLRESPNIDVGARVLAFSNLFGIATGNEPVSMLQGYVSAVAPLEARRGGFSTNYRGEVYIVDAATNNPGASGGALVDGRGRLVGMLGKELRSELTGSWLNYALPNSAFASTVEAIASGEFKPAPVTDVDRPDNPQSLSALGIVLVPEVVSRTPPYVDRVLPNSLAAKAGLRPDDLLVLINSQVVASRREADDAIGRLENDAPVRVSALRGEALVDFSLNLPVDVEAESRGEREPAADLPASTESED